uniref:Uncharacterized protein n=1 Tax=Kalanchoe fedtschenkoi TaxID=63787 RepID=A0A7N0U478_KALFE
MCPLQDGGRKYDIELFAVKDWHSGTHSGRMENVLINLRFRYAGPTMRMTASRATPSQWLYTTYGKKGMTEFLEGKKMKWRR